jgi:hypothetical protein
VFPEHARGFVTLALPEAGLKIRDCVLHEKDGRQWLAFPAKSFVTKDGAKKGIPFAKHTEIGSSRTQRNAFQSAALSLIQRLVDGAPSVRNTLGNHTGAAPSGVEELNDRFLSRFRCSDLDN